MSERKVNLEKIISTEASKFKAPLDQAGIYLFIINCYKETATQVLELAAENAKIGGNNLTRIVDKQSILDTINLIEI